MSRRARHLLTLCAAVSLTLGAAVWVLRANRGIGIGPYWGEYVYGTPVSGVVRWFLFEQPTPLPMTPADFLISACFGLPFSLGAVLLVVRAHVAPGVCPSCGYDLRATPERCPECGARPPTGRPVPEQI
jgi:hypothetical protein